MARKKCQQGECSNNADGHEDEPWCLGVIPALAEPVKRAATEASHTTTKCNSEAGYAEV